MSLKSCAAVPTISRFGIDEFFFHDMIEECGGFDDYEAIDYFEREDEDAAQIFTDIKDIIDNESTPFYSIEDFAKSLITYGLNDDRIYYCYDHAYVDLYDNIDVAGESRGSCESFSDEEWIEILESIDDHVLEV